MSRLHEWFTWSWTCWRGSVQGGARWVLAAVAIACLMVKCKEATRKGAPASGTPAKGAVVMRNGVSMKKLGDVSPGVRARKVYRSDYIDPAPIVLWGNATPAAVMYYHVESNSSERWMIQQIARLDGSKVGGFPIQVKAQLPPEAKDSDFLDIFDPEGILPADVNGDGVEELVMMRKLGGAEVHGLKGPLFQYPSPPAGPGARYEPYLSERVKLEGRDVVYLLYQRKPAGSDAPNLLLRVDARGITRLPLRDLGARRILAMGALQRVKSQDIDELLIHLDDGENDTALARCRPDGTLIAPPRRMYLRADKEAQFEFVPHSDRAVLKGQRNAWVLSPDGTANWIRTIDIGAVVEAEKPQILATVDLAADPKVLFRADDHLWAVNGNGTCFSPAGKGWSALAKPGPYRRLPSPDGARRVDVLSAGEGRVLTLHVREQGIRPMTHEEWKSAADRFLPPAEAAELRKQLEPSLETFNPYRDMRIKRERAERNLPEVHTVDEWKQKLPRSYAEVVATSAKEYDTEVEFQFQKLKEGGGGAPRSPDPEGIRAFLADLEVSARTTLTLIDGASTSAFELPGKRPEVETFMGGLTEFRIFNGTFVAVLALEAVDPAGKEGPAFYLVQAPIEGAR